MIETFRRILGDDSVLDASEVLQLSAGRWPQVTLAARALVKPSTTEEVAQIMGWCNKHSLPMVAHGGLTGLVHATDAGSDTVILSTERMRSIEEINPRQRTATMQAGVTLQALQDAVEEHNLFFPLDLGSRGTATLGGNAATNAGGNRVIRYGMMRDMVLGLEVVLPNGTIVSSLKQLIKDNSGYDLKNLFIGSEGTLGVITRLVLRLREKPQSQNVAIVAVPSFDAMIRLLKHMDKSLSGTLSAFEAMWQSFYKLVTTAPAKARPPIFQEYPYYVLIESLGSNSTSDVACFNTALESAMEQKLIVDAALAQSKADCSDFWSIRDDVAQVRQVGIPIVFDISLPIDAMEGYIDTLRNSLEGIIDTNRLWIFGHLGDGNLHIIAQAPAETYAALRPKVEELVYSPLGGLGGSVSAEHGIGLEKKPYLHLCRKPEEIALMRTIKRTLDPNNLMNPGKVL